MRSSATPSGRRDQAVRPVAEGHRAEPLLGPAHLGHHGVQRFRGSGQLHLPEQRVDPGGLPGKADAEQPAHRAAATVAADEVARAQPCAVGEFGAHPLLVLAQPDEFAAAPDLGAQRGGVLGQQTVRGRLRDAEGVRMRGVQPLRRRLDEGGEEPAGRVPRAEREEPLQQTPLVQHLDAARVQPERADDPGRLRVLLQHERAHPVQPQFAGQHQAGRTATGDDHVDHGLSPYVKTRTRRGPHAPRTAYAEDRIRRGPRTSKARIRHESPKTPCSGFGSTIVRHDPGLAARPPVRYTLSVARSRQALLAFVLPPFVSFADSRGFVGPSGVGSPSAGTSPARGRTARSASPRAGRAVPPPVDRSRRRAARPPQRRTLRSASWTTNVSWPRSSGNS